ncbi:hypothetical protein ABPG77_006439 [Micractinium sp. CCAP 211/92]
MLGGFRKVDGPENDEQVEAARGVAEKGLADRLGAAPTRVEVLAAEKQVVAGTNYKLTLKVDAAGKGVSYYEAKVWAKLPAHGGAMELTSLEEVSADQAGACGADEFPENPEARPAAAEVDDAAAYAVQQLSSQSNSLFPFTLKKVLSAKLAKTTGGVTHHLRLLLSHGTQPDSVYEVEVANPGGSYSLLNSKQVRQEA